MLVSDAPQDIDYPARADATGVAEVTISAQGNSPWLIQQVSVEMAGAPAGSECAIRKIGAPITPLVAAMDAAGGDPPITLWPGQTMTVRWTGLNPGQTGRVFVVYQTLGYRTT